MKLLKLSLIIALGALFLVGCTKKEVKVTPDYDKTRKAAEKSWGEM